MHSVHKLSSAFVNLLVASEALALSGPPAAVGTVTSQWATTSYFESTYTLLSGVGSHGVVEFDLSTLSIQGIGKFVLSVDFDVVSNDQAFPMVFGPLGNRFSSGDGLVTPGDRHLDGGDTHCSYNGDDG